LKIESALEARTRLPGFQFENFIKVVWKVAFAVLFVPLSLTCQTQSQNQQFYNEIDHALTKQFLDCWYPRCVDVKYGGFLSTFDEDWKPLGPQIKAIVNQARHVWTLSQAAMFYPGNKGYLPLAEQGFRFLKDKMWDKEYGGFFQQMNRRGELDQSLQFGDEKRAYGNAFGIYACAAYYSLSGDTSALHLAQRAFRWLDEHARDSIHSGYFQNLKRDGTPVRPNDHQAKGWDRETAGLKDYNSSIHLLEAFTALYQIWPDVLLRQRLDEMFHLIRDTFVSPKGYLRLYFYPDWKPISYRDSTDAVRQQHFELDHVSFGHDIETAFLLIEASEALGIKHDTTTLRIARKLVDHTLRTGWDKKAGGLFSSGYYFPSSDTITIINDVKEWWTQAEALHVTLLASKLFPADPSYFETFKKQWDYMKRYLIDPERGGWYAGGIDNHPEFNNGPKGHEWKATYHETRAMMNCLKLLKADSSKSEMKR
jgi:mannobiose 2-epimerase